MNSILPDQTRYTGQMHDIETDLYYYNARYYDPVIGRFIQADPIVPDAYSTQNHNPYSYVRNNPISYVDPSGYFSFRKLFNSIISAFAGGIAFALAGANPIIAGMVGGFVSGFVGGLLTGNLKNAFIGGIAGAAMGAMGGAIGEKFGKYGMAAMSAAGLGLSIASEGVDGLAYFAGGILGGMAGSAFVKSMGNRMNAVKEGNLSSLEGRTMYASRDTDTMTDASSGGNKTPTSIGGKNELHFNGDTLSVVNDSETIYSTKVTSGKGVHMNNPASQHISNKGPIPEGTYFFRNDEWNYQSKVRQTYNIFRYRADWGDYNVPLSYVGPSNRSSFYLHGGIYPGSAGCIDAGQNIGIIRSHVIDQDLTILKVRY